MKGLVFFLTLLFAGTLVSGCDYAIEEALNVTQRLADSENPREQAAGNSPEASRVDKEAREHFKEGQETRDPDEIAKAVELRPLDVRYRAYQIALLIAYPDDPARERELERSGAILVAVLNNASETGKYGESERVYFFSFYLPALIDLTEKFSADTKGGRFIRAEICVTRARLATMTTPAARQVLENNPYNGPCNAQY